MLSFVIENDDDRIKIEQLYDKYSCLMYSIAYEILKDNFVAEDAVQEAFTIINKKLHEIEETDSRKTKNFLVIIVKNIAINMYNRRNKISFVELEDNLLDDNYSVENIVVSKENQERLLELIFSLKSIYSEVLMLRFSRDYSVKEIADYLKLEEKTVQKRIERGKKELLKLL